VHVCLHVQQVVERARQFEVVLPQEKKCMQSSSSRASIRLQNMSVSVGLNRPPWHTVPHTWYWSFWRKRARLRMTTCMNISPTCSVGVKRWATMQGSKPLGRPATGSSVVCRTSCLGRSTPVDQVPSPVQTLFKGQIWLGILLASQEQPTHKRQRWEGCKEHQTP
jgi:hypothetical protein